MKFFDKDAGGPEAKSHPARGAWIEIAPDVLVNASGESHPARGAWIEIPTA